MKNSIFYFSLFSSFLLCSCIEPLDLAEPADGPEKEIFFFTEYEGVAVMSADDRGVELGNSDQPERDDFIHVRWSLGEHIYFLSKKFEFDQSASKIWGGALCEEHLAFGKEQLEEEGLNWLYFEPSDEFWDCLYLVNCDPGDEVFHFRLMAREKS